MIPAIIVVVVVVVWLLFGKLAGGVDDVVRRDDEVAGGELAGRHELASLIKNDPKLAKDSRLLGELRRP